MRRRGSYAWFIQNTLRVRQTTSSTALMIILLALCATAGCRGRSINDFAAKGSVYYTQFTLFLDNDRFSTANYRSGTLLPINSEVTLLAMYSRETIVRVKATDRVIAVLNAPKVTKENMPQAFVRIFAPSPLDLAGFTDAERAGIAAGHVEVGMSRAAVLAAMGYPIQTEVPVLESPEWRYGKSRWITFSIRFDVSGHVTEIVQ